MGNEYKLRTFRLEDLHQIVSPQQPMPESFYPGQAYTLCRCSGEVVLCCGLRRILPCVAEAWAIVSPITLPGPHAIKIIQNLFVEVSRSMGLKRVFTYVPAQSEKARRFVYAFGFWDCAVIPGLFYPEDAVVSVWETKDDKEEAWPKQLQ